MSRAILSSLVCLAVLLVRPGAVLALSLIHI